MLRRLDQADPERLLPSSHQWPTIPVVARCAWCEELIGHHPVDDHGRSTTPRLPTGVSGSCSAPVLQGRMMRVVDLLHRVARDAFGRSFRVDDPASYGDIDHLFRCRNKVAHRGELLYRDDEGNRVGVDAAMVERWWNSTLRLHGWLLATVQP